MEAIRVYQPTDNTLLWEISKIAESFHVSCYDPKIDMGGSGFSSVRETAKKKAFSELNERHIVQQLKLRPNSVSDWGLNFDSSCSGFATGYSKESALFRAICEGCERWTLSQWIDSGKSLSKIHNDSLTTTAQFISGKFEANDIFTKEVPILVDSVVLRLHVSAVLGWTTNGVFAGYGTKLSLKDSIEHAFVEALRNLSIYQNQISRPEFPYDRIQYFAENASAATLAIRSSTDPHWATPRIKLLRSEQFGEVWIARAIFEGWKPWQYGGKSRFLY